MALTKCRECGDRVSTEAVFCPHCGCPRPAAHQQLTPLVPPTREERLLALRALVDGLVQADLGPLAQPPPMLPGDRPSRPYYTDPLCAKLDILDRALQALRQESHHLDNELWLEWFLDSTWLVSPERGVEFTASRSAVYPPDGIPARVYQPLLLVFLLLYHQRFDTVSDIVHEFTERIWNQLGPCDLDRLSNGRTRCATNIGFAARDLRENLLLRSDKEVAHKTWVLSFHGFLVAARLLEQYEPWQFAAHEDLSGSYGRVLHHQVCNALYAPGGFVELARWLTDKYGLPSRERHPVLRRALHRAVGVSLRYVRAQQTRKLTLRQRIELGQHSLGEFLALPEYEQFLVEFSNYIMGSATFRSTKRRWGVE